MVNKKYNVKQAIVPTIATVEGKHNEKYLAIVGYANRTIKTEICRGEQHELEAIIKNHLIPLGIPIYFGAPKEGYEYKLK